MHKAFSPAFKAVRRLHHSLYLLTSIVLC